MKNPAMEPVLLLLLFCCLTGCGDSEPMPGGYSDVALDKPGVVAAAKFAVAEQAKSGSKVSLVKVIKAQQQVVAGLNYKLVLSVEVGGKKKEVEAIVYKDFEKDTQQLVSWDGKPHKPPRKREPVPGGYSDVAVDDAGVVAAARFAVAEQAKSGSKVSLVQVIRAQSQVVAGLNYKLLLRVDVDGAKKEGEAVVYEDLDDKRKLVSWTGK